MQNSNSNSGKTSATESDEKESEADGRPVGEGILSLNLLNLARKCYA